MTKDEQELDYKKAIDQLYGKGYYDTIVAGKALMKPDMIKTVSISSNFEKMETPDINFEELGPIRSLEID